VKAVENGGTSIGIRCKDGVVLAVEKIVTSKLLKSGANKRIATVDRHLGIVRQHLGSFLSSAQLGANPT
jgi:20S proteasome subunit alpha 7